jgi:uncharacterized protein with NRDE domain
MCTVSLVPHAGGLRLMSNRDERLDRHIARAPRVVALGPRLAAMPQDPTGGGSWIGVNDAGLVAAVLNRYRLSVRDTGLRWTSASRGALVPAALACDSIETALAELRGMDAARFQPFRLVLAKGHEAALVASDTRQITVATSALDGPVMFTASSLGDFLVDAPRRRLFDWLMNDRAARLRGQVLFHRHQWADKRDISVVMQRPEAATVSRTTVDVSSGGITLEYESLLPSLPPRRFEMAAC